MALYKYSDLINRLSPNKPELLFETTGHRYITILKNPLYNRLDLYYLDDCFDCHGMIKIDAHINKNAEFEGDFI
jgi:hypothetical protein